MAKRKKTHRPLLTLLTLLLVLALAGSGFYVLSTRVLAPANRGGSSETSGGTDGTGTPGGSTGAGGTTAPPPGDPTPVATATLGAAGDILLHNPVREAGYNASAGTYDFSGMFRYLKPYVQRTDYAAINLEFAVGLPGKYKSIPFVVPDKLLDALRDSGFPLGLTANNHTADDGDAGIVRTMQYLREKGMDFIGTREKASDKPYLVKEVNGIKLGLACYTYGAYGAGGRKTLNGGSVLSSATDPLLNMFSYSNLESFYAEAKRVIDDMNADGAEMRVFFMHWGEEYQHNPNSYQKAMAQKLCELGVDVIIGGHPHKVQPLEVLTAADGRKTVCLYSMGNILSNQVIAEMFPTDGCRIPDLRAPDFQPERHTPECNDRGHTEDGVLFQVAFTKYSDGSVRITGVDALPTWLQRTGSGGKYAYTIVPLDTSVSDWLGQLGMESDYAVRQARDSYDRTMAQIGSGLEACREAFAG